MKSTIFLLTFVILCSGVLYSAGNPDQLLSKLDKSKGKERFSILYRLVEHYNSLEPDIDELPKIIQYGEEACNMPAMDKDPRREAYILNALTLVYIKQSRFKEALAKATQSMRIAAAGKFLPELAEALTCLGDAYRESSRCPDALKYYNEALQYWENLHQKSRIAYIYNNIGTIYKNLGDYTHALDFYLKALAIRETIGPEKALANIMNNIGIINFYLKDYPRALDYYKKALVVLEKLGNKKGLSGCLNNIAVILHDKKEYATALQYYSRALEYSLAIKDYPHCATAYSNIGELYEDLNNLPPAREYYLKSLALARDIDDKSCIAVALYNLARLYRITRQFPQALAAASESLQVASKVASAEDINEANKELAAIYADMGNFQKAYLHYQQYKTGNDALINESIQNRLTDMQVRYRINAREKEIQALKERERRHKLEIAQRKYLNSLYLLISLTAIPIILLFFLRYRLKLKTQKKIRESEEKYKNLVELANDGITILQDYVFKYLNPELIRMSGYSSEELLGKDFAELIAPEDRDRLKSNYERRLAGEKLNSKYEVTMLDKEGRRLLTEINAGLTVYEGRIATMVFVRDISDKKQLEMERMKRNQLEAVGILAAGIAHDFNNLLSVVMGNIEIAKQISSLDTAVLIPLAKAERAALKTQELALRFLTFSEGGEPLKRNIELAELTKNAVHLPVNNSKIKLHTSFPNELWPVMCDPELILQVLNELLMNAVEALHGQGNIDIKAENFVMFSDASNLPLTPGNYVKISCIDNGEGIPPEHLPKIFDPYFSTRHRVSQGGLGFGLAIVYTIIQRHKGHIRVESQPGKGTVVSFYLPTTEGE